MDIVLDHEELGRPVLQGHPRLHQFRDAVDASRGQGRHRQPIDQHGGSLITHTGAGGQADGDPPILAGFVEADPQPLAEPGAQPLTTQQAVGDVVAEEDIEVAAGPGMQEGVKIDGGQDAGAGHPHRR